MAHETLAGPRWFPLRFDSDRDSYHFVFIPAEVHRDLAFLRDFKPAPSETRILPRASVRNIFVQTAPLHLILHSGLGGSTFLARALAQPGVAISLQEPPILTDVIGYGLKRPPDEMNDLLREVSQLLPRPFPPAKATICKLSGIGNGLARLLGELHPSSQLLCLQNPLEQLLAAFAQRGISGRMRQLLLGIRNSRMMAFEMTDKQLLDHTDFQLAGLAWLSIQKMMVIAAQALGPERLRSITSEDLARLPADTLSAISSHFRLDLDVDRCISSGLLDRHSKTGEPFDPQHRMERLAGALHVHGQEIEPVISWARRVAETTGIPWDLPYPLLERAA
ncbi:MAG TPA: hypothetical protein VE820_11660 [Sphingomicrobium sp.]|nr:hypothetical protein [Sphingomicrobium sp.]